MVRGRSNRREPPADVELAARRARRAGGQYRLMSAVTYATAQILRVLPRARIGQALGRLADRRWSSPVARAVVGLYSSVYDVELDDCQESGGWASFDAFFTRRLRDGARAGGAAA